MMKNIVFTIFFSTLLFISSQAQMPVTDALLTGQAIKTNYLLAEQSMNNQKKGVMDKLHQAKLIQETINVINTIRDVKNVIGTVSATIGDLKNVTRQFYEDFRGLESVGKDELSRLSELMNFRDALEGRGYQSIFGAYDWYVDETARFRDRNGHMDIASAILNEFDPDRALQVYESFRGSYFNMRREQRKCDDMSILEDLAWARYYERQARLLTVVYNMAALENSSNNILNYAGIKLPNIQLTKNGEKYRLTPEGLLVLRQDIESTLQMAAEKRNTAFSKYNTFISQQETAIELALLLQVIKKVKSMDRQLKDSYHNNDEVSYPDYSETEDSWSNFNTR